MAAHHAPVGLPAHRELRGPQRDQPLAGAAQPERLGARALTSSSSDVATEELAVAPDRARPGCVRTGSRASGSASPPTPTTCPADAPRLEQHAGDPPAGRLDGRRGVDVRLARRSSAAAASVAVNASSLAEAGDPPSPGASEPEPPGSRAG